MSWSNKYDLELTQRQIDNFWKKVTKTDTCWIWTGAKNEHGYGVLGLGH